MNSKVITWSGQSVPGKEVLQVARQKERFVATSHVVGGDAELHTTWDAEYEIICDMQWHVRRVAILETQTGKSVTLLGDGDGNWTDEQARELRAFAGCLDIDFRATPFSNTFPICRLDLAVGEAATIEVIYINAPDLALSKEQQVYTRLSKNEWIFEQPSAHFQATIVVDDEGFVVDYPGLFTRL